MTNQEHAIPGRFVSLDAWRGVCALLVAYFHLPVIHAWTGRVPFQNIQFCVDFFFVLSGFVISHAYRGCMDDIQDVRRFVITRFGRLWPLHAAVLVAFVILEFVKYRASLSNPSLGALMHEAAFSPGHSVSEIFTSALFLQAFGLHSVAGWNFPAWSVAAEFYVYLVFAAVSLIFARRRYAVFALLACLAAFILHGVSPQTLFVSFDYGFLRCVFGFFVGCLAYSIRSNRFGTLIAPTILELGAAGLALAYIGLVPQGPLDYVGPLLFGLLIYVFSFDAGLPSRVLAAPPFQKLGLWSYSIYMLHILVFHLARTAAVYVSHATGIGVFELRDGEKLLVLPATWEWPILSFAATALLVVPIAAACYRWIEKPSTSLFRRVARGEYGAGARWSSDNAPSGAEARLTR